MQKVQLGRTGLIVSRLAIGTGTHGWSHASDQTRKGFNWLVNLFKLGYELGVNFWDLADQYGSHRHAKEALKSIDREDIVITSKTTDRDYETCRIAVERFLKELGTDYVDIVLLHAKSSGDWNIRFKGAMDALNEAKEKGLVKAVGISSHGFEALRTAASEPWVDVILVRINYAGVEMDAPLERVIPVLEKAHNAGKGIYAMKVLGCGSLTSNLEKAIGYIMRLNCVDAMTIGHTDHAHLRRNAEIIEKLEKETGS